MDVMHERVAGLDVHKAMIVACARIMTGGKVSREVPDVRDDDGGS